MTAAGELVPGAGSLPPGLSLNAATGVISGTPTGMDRSVFTVQVTDSTTPAMSATQPLSITVVAPLAVTTASLPDGTVGSPYSQTLAAAGGTVPYTWSLVPGAGSLPPGLTLDPATGVISGTPAGVGTSRFTVQVTDSGNPPMSATEPLSITVASAGPLVTLVSPGSGPVSGGTQVTITGSGFTGATAVDFAATAATSFTVTSDTSITTIALAGAAGTVDVTVTTPGGGTSAVSSADEYTYVADATRLSAGPALFKISPGHVTVTLRLSATLTDTVTGQRVVGQLITFTVGDATVCTATTGSQGRAACRGRASVLQVLLAGHYTASFAGTPTLQPATACGQLFRIP